MRLSPGPDIASRLVIGIGNPSRGDDATELLRPLVERFLAQTGPRVFVGADQFIYYIKGNPKAVVAPDSPSNGCRRWTCPASSC